MDDEMDEADLPIWMQLDPDPATIDEIVTRINRVRRSAQQKLAKDIVTIAYLDAGRRVVERHFMGRATESGVSTFLGWITREMIFKEYGRAPNPLPKVPSDGTYRDRWRSKDDFLTDLVAYLNWTRHWDLNRRLAHQAAADLLDAGRPLSEAAEAIAYEDLALGVGPNSMAFRAQMTLQPLAAGHESLRAALAAQYDELLRMWSAAYMSVLNSRGLQLRPDVTVKDLAIILTAVAEGLAMRAMVEGTANIMNDDAKTSLLGTAAMALFASVVDTGNHETVRQVIDRIATGDFRDQARQMPPDRTQ